MKQTKLWMIAAILTICGTAAFASCMANADNPLGQAEESQYVPLAPDYSDPTMWITADGDTDGTGADIFYVVSTWEDDWKTADGKVCHYADVWNPEHRAHMADLEMKKVAAYMSPATLHDTITITVSPEHHVLVATNYSASEYPPFRGFLNVGDIHSCEPWLYSECLKKNIKVRVINMAANIRNNDE